LNQSIGSLLKQTDKRFKIHFSDNASTDESFEIASSLLKHSRIEHELTRHDSQKGWRANFQFLHNAVDTEYFLYLDCEDSLSDNYINVTNQEIDHAASSGGFDFLAPKFLELGQNFSARTLPAPQQVEKIPFGIRLPHYATLPSTSGIGYFIYSVQNFRRTEHVWTRLWTETVTHPTKHLIEDIALSWALLSDCPNFISCSDKIELGHFSKIEVNPFRLLLNKSAYENIVATSAPEIIYEALDLFKKISNSSKQVKDLISELVTANYNLKATQYRLSEALSGQFNPIALLNAGLI
jgi:glycosyltransferase involved in cell wall biosynthesis